MEDEEVFKKLPVEEKCVHKLWKARVSGYEEVTKLFRQIDDEKSPEFAKYLGLVKKFVTDSNAMGQEKGLEATLAYVENYANAGKTVSEVMSGVVSKCVAAPKTKTRELALQLILMYIEIEKQDAVQEELLKGMEQKNPKIVSACIVACTTALKEFGAKVVNVKPLVKKIPVLLADRDKNVRDEAKQMIVEMFRWMGNALRPQIANLQPVQVSELETEFVKVQGQKTVAMRYLRSQQQKQASLAAAASLAEDADGTGGNEEADDEEPPQIDAYDLADPIDILSKLPKDFYDKIEEKKWQDRKDALETLENLLKTPKLENGDYGDLVRALKKIIQKDSNVVVVAVAGRCLSSLATGLKKRFSPYAGACVPALLEKFKEKKQNVLVAIREAIDAIYLTTNIDTILEDVLEALANKNPSVKMETSLFMARAFTKTQPMALNKKLLKALTTALTKNMNESDLAVREATAEALGTLMKLVGEKAIGPFLVDLERDNLKMVKIREFYDKAVIQVKVVGVKKERPITAPPKVLSKGAVEAAKTSQAPPSKPTTKRPTGSANARPKAAPKTTQKKTSSKPIEKELHDEEVDEVLSDLINTNTMSELLSTNWKARLAAMEQISNEIQAKESKLVPSQAIIKLISRKPGLKDTNFQVLKAKLDVVKYLAENCLFSSTCVNCCLNEIAEKFGDPKNGQTVCETMTAMAEATSFDCVASGVMDFAFTQKSPKVMQEVLVWMSSSLKEFGFSNLNAKVLIDNSKKALASSNPAVRQAAITLLGTLYLYMGVQLNVFFESEKPALRDQINAEFDKYEGEKPPQPTRGVKNSCSSNSLDQEADEEVEPEAPIAIQDLMPRIDISAQITEGLLNELSDKNWKVRIEALTKINNIISEAKFIKSNLGDLPQALALRLGDSNVRIAQIALSTCEAIAKAMGAPSKQYIRVFFPGFLQALGDNKSWMRTASLEAINTFASQCGYKEFFDGEMIGDALKTGSPTLRIELWNWLAENLGKVPLKGIPKEELVICVPHLFSNLEDRNVDVRKNAQEAILGIMIHLGFEPMAKQTEKLKHGSRQVVMTALEKVRPNLPVKALPKKAVPVEKEDKVVRGTKAVATTKNAVKSKAVGASKSAPAATSRKKDEDIDTSPLLAVNNLKHQRTIDESKLKVLKWNFTQPRDEFVELLKDQMTTANVNKTLMFNMFHSDFRYHIKAIESLLEDLPDNGQALIANLDLILKWLTLRFFDTNPSVLLKGLEYLHSVFNMLLENKYRMLENEAASFIPYLVVKIGDPKDSVRNGVRALFKQIGNVYPISRLFTYIMEGLKSKNARQRAECLEVMDSIIECYGISVCVPSPGACLKEVAKQISDRDNSVRNAALNCVVQAYNIVGEKIYKMVGNISDKDLSLLEERIKRSSRKTMVKPPKQLENLQQQQQSNVVVKEPQLSKSREELSQPEDDEMEDEENLPPVTLPPQIIQEAPKEVHGPYKLDPELLQELNEVNGVTTKKQLIEFDLGFCEEDIKVPSLTDARVCIMPLSPPKPVVPNEAVSKSLQALRKTSKTQDPMIENVITKISSTNPTVALEGVAKIQQIINSPKGSEMVDYEDDLMRSIVAQFRNLKTQDPRLDPVALQLYRNELTLIDSIYNNEALGRSLTVPVIKDIMSELISIMCEGKLDKCQNGEAYIRVLNLHCVKIIERSDHTKLICALIQVIEQCISNDSSPRQVDLSMKCIWRVIKFMPSWDDDLDYDSILLEVHNFLKRYPSMWWKSRPADTPLRTIKTIIHSCVKIKGSTLMLHLGKIPNSSESEVETYILKLLKSLKIEEVKQVPLKTERRSLSRANHNMLTDIFQKIGDKQETKEGLTLLYDFMQQHPEADIDPFLMKASKFFQDYIKDGLKEIKDARKANFGDKKEGKINSEFEKTVASSTGSAASPNAHLKTEFKDRISKWSQRFQDLTGKPYEAQ